jgi:CheY-like chemotaxis protein
MKVLVIDDTRVHRSAAKQTLVGHDVTVCSTHEEAVTLLSVRYDKEEIIRKLIAQGLPSTHGDVDSKNKEACNLWWAAHDKAKLESLIPYWDVVLCDLLMPAGPMAQGGEGKKYVGQEMAVGWSLALKAAQNGARYVAVVTDMNHHCHPASAMLDDLDGHIFGIDGAKMLLTNHVRMVGIAGTECACEKCGGTGKDGEYKCWRCDGTGVDYSGKGKDWGKILEHLVNDEKEYQG